MEWVKLSATPAYYLDGALLRAGEAAEVLFCRGLAYCGTVESGGVIDKDVLPMLVQVRGPARVAALVREGLWLDEGTTWRIRSWDKWQDEHDVAAEKRRKDKERQRQHRRKSREAETSSRDSHTGLSRDSHSDKRDSHRVDREVEKEEHQDPPAPPIGDDDPGDFTEFWEHYPRKISKQSAIKAYRKARKLASAADILAGVIRYAAEQRGKDATYIKHPDAWLNSRRWEDDPAPRPNVNSFEDTQWVPVTLGAGPTPDTRPETLAAQAEIRRRFREERQGGAA